MKPNIFRRAFLISAAVAVCAFSVFGQQQNRAPAQTAPPVTANEDFELNIRQDRITETNFERSTGVELSDAARGGLRVAVGVGASASRIDVLLLGIFGRVRFRASLEQIQQRLERPPTAQPGAPK